MKGGFLDTLTNWSSSLSQGASNLLQKAKQATASATSGLTTPTSYSQPAVTPVPQQSYTSSPPIVQQQQQQQQQAISSAYGGRTRRKRRHMKGGFHPNTPTTGLVVHAAPFSGPSARPHNWVGGKTRRHKKKGTRRQKRR